MTTETIDVSGRAARDVILTMFGVDASAGPLAYWRSHEIHDALRDARLKLSDLAGADLDVWWLTAPESARSQLVTEAQLPVLDVVARPWVDVRVLWGSRVPYVPIAAFMHVMAAGDHATVGDAADGYGITEATTPWDLLELLDGRIEGTPHPQDLPVVAGGLRLALNHQPDDDTAVYNPARWLLQHHRCATWETLAAVADAAVVDARERQERRSGGSRGTR